MSMLVDRPLVIRVTSLKNIIKLRYDAYTYPPRLIHSACFSVLLAVCASCLPRVPMATKTFDRSEGLVRTLGDLCSTNVCFELGCLHGVFLV